MTALTRTLWIIFQLTLLLALIAVLAAASWLATFERL